MTHSRILIVEDEAIIAADLQRRLSRLGCNVVGTAASGEDAGGSQLRRPALASSPTEVH